MSEILTREELERLILDNCDSAGCCTNSGGGVNYGPCTRCAVLLAHDAALRSALDKAKAALGKVADEAEHNSDCGLEDGEPCDCHVHISARALAEIERKGEK